MTWKELDGAVPYITIDLGDTKAIKSIAIFQPTSTNNRMKRATIKISDDGEEYV